MDEELILAGEPGERWSNQTGLVLWQLRCSFANSCGWCISLHHAISDGFPLPFHRRCRCIQTPVYPGAVALPWVDYRKVFGGLSKDKRKHAVGKSVDKLIAAGIVTLDEAVLPGRPKSLEEIAAEQGLSAQDMIKAGVDPKIAEKAAGQPKLTPEQAEEAHRARVRDRLASPESPPPSASEPAKPGPAIVPTPRPKPPGEVLRAGNEVLDRTMRSAGLTPVPLPDFGGDTEAAQQWIMGVIPLEFRSIMTHLDWALIFAAVDAQERLKKLFKRLKVDEKKAMEAMAIQ